jgi:hypothetical protein
MVVKNPSAYFAIVSDIEQSFNHQTGGFIWHYSPFNASIIDRLEKFRKTPISACVMPISKRNCLQNAQKESLSGAINLPSARKYLRVNP